MATVVKTQRPEDFLALVPQLAGFRPCNSIIIVAFRGNRTCAAMRFDLPGVGVGVGVGAGAGAGVGAGAGAGSRTASGPDGGERPGTGTDPDAALHYDTIAGRLVGILCKVRGADAVVPVVYTDDRFSDAAQIPHAAFVDAVVDHAKTAGFLVRDALCVAGDGWGSYLDEDRQREPRPLAAIESSPVNGAIPHEVRNELMPVDAGSELPPVDLATKERVARLVLALREYIGNLRDRIDPDGTDPDEPDGYDELFRLNDLGDGADGAEVDDDLDDYANDLDAGLDDLDDYVDAYDGDDYADNPADDGDDLPRHGWLPGYAEDALQFPPDLIDDEAAAGLILCLQSPMMRDVVMLQWAFCLKVGELALDENARYFDGADPAGFLAAPLMWGDGPRPNVPRVRAAIALVKALAARAPRSMRPPLLCQLAWFNWALGRSSLAGRFIEEAERIDAHYGLAELLRSMLDAGHLPEWAFAIPDDDVSNPDGDATP